MLTQAELKSQLHYDAEAGLFTWLRTSNHIKIGSVAGTLDSGGHVQIKILSKLILAHRLAFLYTNGALPVDCVDHINGVRADNRWCNLREANNQQNSYNAALRKTSTTGVSGVNWCKRDKKFIARCSVSGKRHLLGYFDNLESAKQARQDFAKLHHMEFYRES